MNWRDDVEQYLAALADGPGFPLVDAVAERTFCLLLDWQFALEDFDLAVSQGRAQPDHFPGYFS